MDQIKRQTVLYLSILGLLFFVIFFQGIFTNLSTAAMREIQYSDSGQAPTYAKPIPYQPAENPVKSSAPIPTPIPVNPEPVEPLRPINPKAPEPMKPIKPSIQPVKPSEGPVKQPIILPPSKTTVTGIGDPVVKPTPMLWGAFAGNGLNDLEPFEKLVGEQVDIRAYFLGWGDSFPTAVASKLKASGKTLLIFWEPYGTSVSSIAEGKSDAYIKTFAAQAKASGVSVMLAPFHEMNGNWDPWGGYNSANKQINTAKTIIDAWRRIHSFFPDAKNVKFAWAVNNVSVPNILANDMSVYYPGDAYVDYVGVDGFNFNNPWQSFAQVFDKAINKVSVYKKPIYIFSMGCVANPKKADWIKEGLGKHVHQYKIAGWVWFNQDGGDGNWVVNSDPDSLAAFKAVIPK